VRRVDEKGADEEGKTTTRRVRRGGSTTRRAKPDRGVDSTRRNPTRRRFPDEEATRRGERGG
jgi:hypothetical protein